MKTFFTVKFVLLPLALFIVLIAYAPPEAAIAGGLIMALYVCAWQLRWGQIKQLELAMLAIFVALAAGVLLLPQFVGTHAAALAFAGLGAYATGTVVWRHPWTVEFSRAAYTHATGNPIFFQINMILSAVWAVLFFLLALVSLLKAGSIAATAIVILGAVISILGPRALIRRSLARRSAGRETYRWSAPAFDGPSNDVDCDVAIIGAGIGGLTAAALLADAGLKVIVVEQQLQAGGFCQTFSRKLRDDTTNIFRFDAGPHDFSGAWQGGPVASVLMRLGVMRQIEWRRIDHTYRLPGLAIDVSPDWRDYVAELRRLFPSVGSGFDTLFAAIRNLLDAMYSPLVGSGGIPGLGVTAEAMQAFARQYPLAVQWLDRPFDNLVAQHISDPTVRRLLVALTGYAGGGSETPTCAQMVPLFGCYFHGGYYPLGGSGQVARALVAALRQRGGDIRFDSPVQQIAIERGRAAGLILSDGQRISANAVVTNADLKQTFLELVTSEHLPSDFRTQIMAVEPACSAFSVHLGIDFIPKVRPVLHVRGDPSIVITTMSLLDPSAAPVGHSTVAITTLVPHSEARTWFAQDSQTGRTEWLKSPDYADRKKRFGDGLIALAETFIPGLSHHIVYRDEASPLTFARYDWSTTGSIYGVTAKGRLKGVKSPIPGLVVAGSPTHGAGVEAALISGAFAADALVPGLLGKPPSKSAPISRRAA